MTQEFTAGQRFERYQIIRGLGKSIAGDTYEAEDTILQRKVALKLIHPWSHLPDAAQRQFFREMQSVSLLTHQYLAAILDYGEVEGQLYIARRYVDAGSLLGTEGRSRFNPPLDVQAAIVYATQLANALSHIHNYGYIHGSLTLSNILVIAGPSREGEIASAPFLLSDIGITHFVRRFGHSPQSFFPITTAPEQFDHQASSASDQYALAVLLYLWLGKRPPFLGSPQEVLQAKRSATFTALTALNFRVNWTQEGIIRRALSAYPEERYPSILDFSNALLNSLSVSAAAISFSVPQTDTVETKSAEVPSSTSPVSSTTADNAQPSTSSQQEDGAQSIPDRTEHIPSIPRLARPIQQPTSIAASEAWSLPFSTVSSGEEMPLDDQKQQEFPTTDTASESAWDSMLRTLSKDGTVASQVTNIAPEPHQPDPLPPMAPDVPQPIPTPSPQPPAIPEPEPVREPQPEPQPSPDTLPQPAPDIPLPVPDPTPTPPIEPVTDEVMQENASSSSSTTPSLTERAWLTILFPNGIDAETVVLEKDEVSIGRAGSSDIRLDQDEAVSRHHALLQYDGTHYFIYDRRSANGVLVNDEPIPIEEPFQLNHADSISIGAYMIRFHYLSSTLSHPSLEEQNHSMLI